MLLYMQYHYTIIFITFMEHIFIFARLWHLWLLWMNWIYNSKNCVAIFKHILLCAHGRVYVTLGSAGTFLPDSIKSQFSNRNCWFFKVRSADYFFMSNSVDSLEKPMTVDSVCRHKCEIYFQCKIISVLTE